uniref:Zinc metalloproteinase-disintegrin-like 2d n=1 Tax=Takifugu rubripes TaxID=31033 RepID=A0A3B5JUP6_TAKRU
MGSSVLSLWLACVYLSQSSGTLSHVDTYEVVRPHRLLGRQRRSPGDHQLYPDTMRYELPIEGRNLTIHLEKNRGLFGMGYTQTLYAEDGRRVTSSPEEEHCYYHGHIEGMRDSSVSVGLCSGIYGFLKTRRRVYLIEPLGGSDEGEHAVFRREQLKVSGTRSCGSVTLYDGDRDPKPAKRRSRSWKPKPGTGVQKFVELFVVVDNTEYKRYGSGTKARILGAVNHIDKLYRTLNIRVVLVGLEIWTYKDLFDVDSNPETTLDKFLLWRQSNLLQRTKHDNAQFVTGKDFEGDTVGLANKFAMCTENSGGVNQDHHDDLIGLASTVAHEMGHNFGMSHDVLGCACGPSLSSNCVMADKLSTGNLAFPEFFSDCSVEQLADFMARAQPSCLSRPPGSVETIAVAPLCGNHLLDGGEECDCGTVEECDNLCCDPSTCRLTQGSQCSDGPCCEDCQLKQAGSVCRTSAGQCDLAEYCTGASEECPEDSFEMNGKPCYNRAEGYCHDGQCPTYEQHCWRVFGPGAVVGPDVCFNMNKRGERGTNCGRNKYGYGYAPCTPQNVKCGSMFCGGGSESVTGKRADYTVFGIQCKQAVDDDKTRNLNMVPTGARCGPNKVCLDNRCVDVSVYGVKEDCAKKCSNNGVCNHKKECHCNPGWAPPYCNVQYAELPHGRTGIIAGVCALLSILLLISGGILWRVCCKKAKRDNYNAKRKVHSAPNKLNTILQQLDPKDRPQISEPTFMESTAAQACVPLMPTPSRPPPQPPKKFPAPPPTSTTEATQVQPPSKPLPPPSQTQVSHVHTHTHTHTRFQHDSYNFVVTGSSQPFACFLLFPASLCTIVPLEAISGRLPKLAC